jgi:hypothetical protein
VVVPDVVLAAAATNDMLEATEHAFTAPAVAAPAVAASAANTAVAPATTTALVTSAHSRRQQQQRYEHTRTTAAIPLRGKVASNAVAVAVARSSGYSAVTAAAAGAGDPDTTGVDLWWGNTGTGIETGRPESEFMTGSGHRSRQTTSANTEANGETGMGDVKGDSSAVDNAGDPWLAAFHAAGMRHTDMLSRVNPKP